MWTRRTMFVVALLLALCRAQGQDAASGDTLRSIAEVTVWSSVGKEIVPSQRLEGRRLETLSSFSVADAVRYFAGVQIKDYGGVGGLKTVDVRSMGTNHMGVFYDGIQLGNAQNGQVDLGRFSLDNVESISLYNGQKSDIFQPARDYGSSGTVYIRTRRPRFEEGRRRNLRLTMKSGSFGLIDPSILWEQRWGGKMSSAFSAEYIHATGRYRFRYRKVMPDGTTAWDTTAVRHNGDVESVRVEGTLFGTMTDGQWNAKAYFYTSEKGIPGAIVNNVWKRSQRQWDRDAFLQGSMRKSWGGYHLMVNAKYANDHMRYLNPDTTLLYIDNTFDQQEFYLSVANHYGLTRWWDVALSADYQYNTLDATLRDFVYPHRHTFQWAAATTIEWWRLRLLASLLGTHVGDRVTRHVGDGRHEERWDARGEYTPALFLTFRPLPCRDLSLRAFYKRIFRMPTFNDLYYTDIGNISLDPEYTTQYNIGLHYDHRDEHRVLRHLEARVDAYRNLVDNKIIAVPKGNGQYRWMMMNIGHVRIHGIDVSGEAQLQPCRDLTAGITLNYTYQRAQDYSDPSDCDPRAGTYRRQIAYIPWHSGSVVAHAAWRHWSTNYSFVYVGERYHNSANIAANYEQPWYTHDVTLARSFCWGAGHEASVAVECNNVLDQQYDVVLNYPMPGRNWKVILRVGF